MGVELFNRKVLITIVVIATALAAVAFAAHLTWVKHNESKPVEAYGFFKLPSPSVKGNVSVEEAIQRRRSVRSYSGKPLSLQDISQLMWSAQGITDPARGFRAAPSAGATYPLEVYLVVGENGVTGLDEGLYRYNPHEHQLEKILEGDLRSALARAALDQSWVREAPISIVVVAVYERTTSRYGERGVRYVHMEVGHVGQNLYLQATARGLGMVVVGAFNDDDVRSLLRLPYDQKPLYIIPVGHPRS